MQCVTSEGINEKGFSASTNTLRKSIYQKPSELGQGNQVGGQAGASETKGKPNVLWGDLNAWLLTNFATTKEAIAGLKAVNVVGPPAGVKIDLGDYYHWGIEEFCSTQKTTMCSWMAHEVLTVAEFRSHCPHRFIFVFLV